MIIAIEDKHAAEAVRRACSWRGSETEPWVWQHRADQRSALLHDYGCALAQIAAERSCEFIQDERHVRHGSELIAVHYVSQPRKPLSIDRTLIHHAADIHILAGPATVTGEWGWPWDIELYGWISDHSLAARGRRIVWPTRTKDRERIAIPACRLTYMDRGGWETSWWWI